MSDAIKDLFEKYGRPRYPEVKELDNKIYRDEISFRNLLNAYQIEKFEEIRMDNFHLRMMLEEKAFEQGFYVAYRLLKDMENGIENTYLNNLENLIIT